MNNIPPTTPLFAKEFSEIQNLGTGLIVTGTLALAHGLVFAPGPLELLLSGAIGLTFTGFGCDCHIATKNIQDFYKVRPMQFYKEDPKRLAEIAFKNTNFENMYHGISKVQMYWEGKIF